MIRSRPVLPIIWFAVAAMALGAEPAVHIEEEPSGFTVPAPVDLGGLGSDGLIVEGTLSQTHPTGLAPGDDDGFTFLVEEAWVGLTIDLTSPEDVPFLVTLAEEGAEGAILLASRLERPPLRIHIPGRPVGRSLRVGVAAFDDGPPADYVLTVAPAGDLPLWSGAICETPFLSAEPDDDAFSPGDLGDFDRILCGEGVLATMPDPENGVEGDVDHYVFRNLLPVPARLALRADPGEVRVDVERFIFIGRATVVASSFGEVGELLLPKLPPGETILVRVAAVRGGGPIGYRFHLEPVAETPEELATGLQDLKGRVRLAGKRPGFRLKGRIGPGIAPPPFPGAAFLLRIGDEELTVEEGELVSDALGRLWWKGEMDGSALSDIVLTIDSFNGLVRVRGSGVPVAEDATSLRVEIRSGAFLLGGEAPIAPRKNGRVLKVF